MSTYFHAFRRAVIKQLMSGQLTDWWDSARVDYWLVSGLPPGMDAQCKSACDVLTDEQAYQMLVVAPSRREVKHWSRVTDLSIDLCAESQEFADWPDWAVGALMSIEPIGTPKIPIILSADFPRPLTPGEVLTIDWSGPVYCISV